MAENWTTTAKYFSSLFKKPQMVERLLCKPPFKYIFDIIAETSKQTGLCNGLFTEEESVASYYTDRDTKIAYLVKIITLVQLIEDQKCPAIPSKIIAGVQTENTNIMLQMVYKAAVSGADFSKYVAMTLEQVNNGKQITSQKQIPQEDDQAELQQKKMMEENQRKEREMEKKKQLQIQKEKEREDQMRQQKMQEQKQKEEEETLRNQQNLNQQKEIKGDSKYMKEVQQQQVEQEQEQDQQQTEGKQITFSKKIGRGKNKQEQKQQEVSQQPQFIQSDSQTGVPEIEVLQKLVQQISQNTAYLGKSLEFVNEDIENMNNEYSYWSKQYIGSKDKLQVEERQTEEHLQPLMDKINDVDDQVTDIKEKIQAKKNAILRNQQTIQNLLYSVVVNN